MIYSTYVLGLAKIAIFHFWQICSSVPVHLVFVVAFLATFCWLSSFWHNYALAKQIKFGISGIFFRTHGRKGLKFDMLVYPDRLWEWLHFGHDLLIFLILAAFWLRETGQTCSLQAFSWKCMEIMGCILSCCYIQTTSRTDSILDMVCWFSSSFP